jgi:hypothetical protein
MDQYSSPASARASTAAAARHPRGTLARNCDHQAAASEVPTGGALGRRGGRDGEAEWREGAAMRPRLSATALETGERRVPGASVRGARRSGGA